MSFETTLICDGCSSIIDSGQRPITLRELKESGGRAFVVNPRSGAIEELPGSKSWSRTQRHLCSKCASTCKQFVDGTPVAADLQGEEGR